MTKLIAAYTPPTSPYPPYINISRDGDEVVVTVRGEPRPGEFSDKDCGPTTSIRLSAEAWNELRAGVIGEFVS